MWASTVQYKNYEFHLQKPKSIKNKGKCFLKHQIGIYPIYNLCISHRIQFKGCSEGSRAISVNLLPNERIFHI